MKRVLFVDDLFRNEVLGGRRCIFNTLFALFKRAFDIEIQAPRFSPNEFQDFAAIKEKYKNLKWEDVYWGLPQKIEQEYIKLIDAQETIYISYEAPEWLYKVWQKYNVKYIDLRLSYLRFLPDIPIMVSTNIPSMITATKELAIKEEDILLEANLLKGNYNFRYQIDKKNCARYRNSLIVIGQTDKDTSLMEVGKTRQKRFQDYSEKIKTILRQYHNVFYKKHPFSPAKHAKEEIEFLNSISPKPVLMCTENFYNLAVQAFRIDFMGLSSGALEEAAYFGQKTFKLMDFPFSRREAPDSVRYLNIQSYYFFSPKFWQDGLGAEIPVFHPCNTYREMHPNIMREHHNESWGYNEFYFDNRRSTIQSIAVNSAQLSTFISGEQIHMLKLCFQKNQYRLLYYYYKLRAKLSFGKKRTFYKQKRREYKEIIRKIRRYIGDLQ